MLMVQKRESGVGARGPSVSWSKWFKQGGLRDTVTPQLRGADAVAGNVLPVLNCCVGDLTHCISDETSVYRGVSKASVTHRKWRMSCPVPS